MADIISINPARLREAKEALEATARLHEVLCLAADETATRALSVKGRLQLLSALLPAFAPGLAWELRYVGQQYDACAYDHQ